MLSIVGPSSLLLVDRCGGRSTESGSYSLGERVRVMSVVVVSAVPGGISMRRDVACDQTDALPQSFARGERTCFEERVGDEALGVFVERCDLATIRH